MHTPGTVADPQELFLPGTNEGVMVGISCTEVVLEAVAEVDRLGVVALVVAADKEEATSDVNVVEPVGDGNKVDATGDVVAA